MQTFSRLLRVFARAKIGLAGFEPATYRLSTDCSTAKLNSRGAAVSPLYLCYSLQSLRVQIPTFQQPEKGQCFSIGQQPCLSAKAEMSPVGVEPTTYRLRAGCSAN